MQILKCRPNQEKSILRTELAYFSHTHKTDKVQRPELYRQNCISQEEKIEDLCIFTDDAQQCSATTANLPTNEDGIKALSNTSNGVVTTRNYEVKKLCVVLWADKNIKYQWYLGYIKERNADGYMVDHLDRSSKTQNKYWKYPKKADIQLVEDEQSLEVEVEGEWTLDSRNHKFILNNEKEILYTFKENTA